ncbi:uncharacterized [Tachysurus ichikawai]
MIGSAKAVLEEKEKEEEEEEEKKKSQLSYCPYRCGNQTIPSYRNLDTLKQRHVSFIPGVEDGPSEQPYPFSPNLSLINKHDSPAGRR